MGRRGLCAIIALALAAALGSELSATADPDSPATSLRRLAAISDDTECQQAALYIIPALPNVKDAAVFQRVRATYIDTVKSLGPAGAISDVLPTLVEPNRAKGGVSVHTTILFSGSCEAGKAAARTLHVKLLGDVRPLFYVPAPNARSLFGNVYMITVGFPYLADENSAKLVVPATVEGTNLAAQFSITWEDIPPSKIGELQSAAFKAAILRQLPAGAGVYFTTMITEGVSYRFGNHWRACAAPVPLTVAKSAGKTSQGGEVWPPGQPATTKAGRLVFNTNIHGTVFNTAAGRVTLTQFMQLLRSNTAAVFPRHTFGRMALEPGYGLRLVNDPTFPCTCEFVPPPTLTLAQAFGPNSATAVASGAANITWVRWQFTATPASGAGISQEADAPLVWWYNLAADTPYTISVVGITAAGQRVPGANTLSIQTPQAGAPTVAAANPTSSTQASVRVTPPNGQTVSLYVVKLCLQAQPTSCVEKNSTSIQLAFSGLTPGALFVVSATALIGSTVVPASNTLPLAMPQSGAPILLTAAATTARTGAATAAAPSGPAISKYVFTATSPSGAPDATSTVTDPLDGNFTGLRPATQYDVTVVGYRGATPTPPSNSLSFVTPAANAPLNTGTPRSPTLVFVNVVPPTIPPINGGSWVTFDVTLCPLAGPESACVTKRVGGTGRRLLAPPSNIPFSATPDTTYNLLTIAFSQSGEQSKQSMTAQVTTPAAIPWSVRVVPESPTQTSASIEIDLPIEGGPFDSIVLSVCPKPTSGAPNWDACPKTNCLPTQVDGCEVTGLTANTAFVVSGVAFTADGVATIRSSAAPFTTLPWPAPTIDSVEVGLVDLSTAVVTIVGPSVVPPGGYTRYNLTVCATNPAGDCTYQACTPVRAPPATTACTLTGLNQNTTFRVRAVAVQGSIVSEPSNFPYFRTKLQDPATLVSVQALSYDSGIACVKAPTLGGPWTGGFQCEVCYKGVCRDDVPKCTLNPRRRLLGPACQDSTTCELGTLESSTDFNVSCVALTATDAPSPESNSLVLTTEPAPAPPVITSPTNPVILQCTAPGGGPWATCTLELCEQPGPARRRQLRGDGGCFPISLSCPFVNGVAACDVTGKVRQETSYDVTSTAIKADGVRKSTTGPQPVYLLPYFPAPTVTAVFISGTSYNVTIVPVASPALIAWPVGGWNYFSIYTKAGNSSNEINQGFSCTAKNDANGVPQAVTCQVTLASSNLPAKFSAQGFQGDENTPKDTDLRTAEAEYYSPIAVVSGQSNSYDSGYVCVTPPSAGGPWVETQCRACQGSQCGDWQSCSPPSRRRHLLKGWPCDAYEGSKECVLNGLESLATYTVTCEALTSTAVASPPSNPGTFTTTQAPPPSVIKDPFNRVGVWCSPPDGGPWATCELSICAQPTRRRLLFIGCTPVTTTCAFESTPGGVVAACDLGGLVPQNLALTINATAIKADGVRKSEMGAQPSVQLDYYPKPTITTVNNVALNTYTVTVQPDTTTLPNPYPTNPTNGYSGWSYFSVVSSNCGTTKPAVQCIAVNDGSGVPQTVTCTVASDLPTPIDFTAVAVKNITGRPELVISTVSDPKTFVFT